MGRHHRDYSQSSYSQWNHPHRARPEWGIGAATPLLAIALASCHDEIKPEISGTPENDIAPAQDDDDQGGGILYLTGWLMLLASLGQNSSSGASSTPVTPDPTPPDPVIAELRPPVFSAASYDFALDENIDGTEEAALIDHVSATSPDGHPVRYFLEDDNGNQVAATGGMRSTPIPVPFPISVPALMRKVGRRHRALRWWQVLSPTTEERFRARPMLSFP
jgi:hypothetical protein